MSQCEQSYNARRDFLKQSGILTAGAFLAATGSVPRVHAAGGDQIKVAIVGFGSRGRGALRQALAADSGLVAWAAADVFDNKMEGSFKSIQKSLEDDGKSGQMDLPKERQFVGFDAYKKAMDRLSPGDTVILATPPVFRPLHFAYAVEKGLNVFAEKPLAVDIPGLKALAETNKIALQKGLKVAVGLNNRHYFRTEETIEKIHDGGLGELSALWLYRMHPTHKVAEIKPGVSQVEHQLRHLFNFNWTTGGFIVDALIHNLDVCCWALGQLPVAAQGQGGRLLRKVKDQMIDHAAIEYRFADGRRMMMFAQTMENTFKSFESVIQGAKGSAIVGEGVAMPRFFKDFNSARNRTDGVFWTPEAPENNSYQTEHDRFFKAIRENRDWNEMQRGIDATFVPILGRMAMETGQMVTAEEAWNSSFQYVSDAARMTMNDPAPVMPDENGDFPQAIPGVTKI